MSGLRWCAILALVAVIPTPLASQAWDEPAVRELVARATARREAVESESPLLRWEARARGTVLFLTQVGGDDSPPRMVKADQLVVEVYWEAPGHGKQEIIAWRDRAWLPTDIQYHRDHLGTVTNDFGPVIRIGDGDEVRDVLHPLSSLGAARYEFALGASVTVESAGRTVSVRAVRVRPRDLNEPGVVGTLYLDSESAALVRFRFSFTPSSYRETALEDITVVLENALHSGRDWLPWRQTIEIRRRAGVVDFPARGIIRGEWELDDFQLGPAVAPRVRAGPAIGGLRAPGGDPEVWDGSLEDHVAGLGKTGEPLDPEALREEIRAVAGRRLQSLGPPARLAAGRLSDVIRVNRVEGVRLGLGMALRPALHHGLVLSPWVGYGMSSRRVTGRVDLSLPLGRAVEVRGGFNRLVEDFAGEPPLAVPLNSLLSQEFGVDRGDWVDHEAWHASVVVRAGSGSTLAVRLAREEWHSRTVLAEPARGAYRPNPQLGAERHGTVSIEWRRLGHDASGPPWQWRAALEGGTAASGEYLRLEAELVQARRLGPGEARIIANGGWSSARVPPARQFAIGGWGTLPGEPYRGYGGRWALLGRVEYLVPVTVPEVPLGSFAGTGDRWSVGPFVAVGGGGGSVLAPVPWGSSGGVRPVVGVAVEGLWGLVRAEFGWALRAGRGGGSADLAKSWWAIL